MTAVSACAAGTYEEPAPDAGPDTPADDQTASSEAADAAPPAPDAAASCVDGSKNAVDPVTGRCVMLFTTKTSWDAARMACEALGDGAQLVAIDDLRKNDVVKSMAGQGDVWVGATDKDTEGTWAWATGLAWGYQNWRAGEPNNTGNEDCMVLEGKRGGSWDDRSCGASHRYVCER